MINILRYIRIPNRLHLLALIYALCFVGYGVWTFRAMDEVRIGGDAYRQIEASQKLTTDAYPAPLYIIESYLLCYQMLAAETEQAKLDTAMHMAKLEAEYVERQQYWDSRDLSDNDSVTVRQIDAPAAAFYNKARNEYIPAILANDKAKARKILAELSVLFNEHKQAISLVVMLANKNVADKEINAALFLSRTSERQFVALVVALAVALVLTGIINRSITKPIYRANKLAKRVADGDFTKLEVDTHPDELGKLLTSMSVMCQNLTHSKQELIRRERLASLGSLVEGITLELNTPVGNSLTVASTMEATIDVFKKALEENITRTSLNRFVLSMDDGVEMLLRNLNKTINLITGFKQLAIDQSSIHRRIFHLDDQLKESIQALAPLFRNSGHTINLNVSHDIELNTFPGYINQIFMHLIGNSVQHGFENVAEGVITISAEMVDSQELRIVFKDNGVGIPDKYIDRIFDPFFTTKRQDGATGLGLVIVHDIVTDFLGGTISATSEPGLETTFVITIPPVTLDLFQ